jgi:hypothetical protein
MNAESARDDLAFMRALVSAGDDGQKTFGEVYFAAGLCYGVQMLLHGAQFLGLMPSTGLGALAIGFGPTVVFLVSLIWILGHQQRAQAPNAVNRAVGAAFGAVGLANLMLILIIGSIAWRLQNVTVWLIYPCVVMILQGLAWLVAFMLRRRSWMAAVAGGWFATGVGMGFAILNLGYYVIVAGVGMVAFMLVPGLLMMRQARRSA